MTNNKLRIALALSSGLFCGLFALNSWAAPMDFASAYEAAQQHDPRILSARAAAQSAQERLPQARAQRLPNLSLSASQMRNNLETQSANILGQASTTKRSYDSSNQALQLRQPLYRPALVASIAQAKAQVEDAQANLQSNEDNLLERVAQTYFDALLAQVQVRLSQAQQTAFTEQLNAAQQSFNAGSGVRTDVDEAQARVDLAHAQILQAEQNLSIMRQRLQVLTGQPDASSVETLADLDSQRFAPHAPQPPLLQDWVALAEEASPQLRSLRAQAEAAKLEVRKAEAGHKPTLDLIAAISRSDSDSVTSVNTVHKQKYIGVQLNVPLYAGGAINSSVRQALAEQERTEQALQAVRQDLSVQVHEQFSAMTEGVLRIAALEQAVRSAQQALLSSQKSQQAGVRTTVDVLNAEQQLTLAQRDLAQARYSYVLAGIKLDGLAGQERLASVQRVNQWLTPSSQQQP